MDRTIGDILVERIDTGGLSAAAVDQLLAQRRAGLAQKRLALRYGVSVRRLREIERAARDLPIHLAADAVLAVQRAGLAPRPQAPAGLDDAAAAVLAAQRAGVRAAAPSGRPSKWTDAKVALLRRAYAEGRPVSQVEAETGLCRTALYAKARELGLSTPQREPWTQAEIAALRQGYAEGLPRAELAARTGRTEYACVSKARDLGLLRARPEPRLPWSQAHVKQLRQLTAAGHTSREIAERLGRTEDAVNKKRFQLKPAEDAASAPPPAALDQPDTLATVGASELDQAVARALAGLAARRDRDGATDPAALQALSRTVRQELYDRNLIAPQSGRGGPRAVVTHFGEGKLTRVNREQAA